MNRFLENPFPPFSFPFLWLCMLRAHSFRYLGFCGGFLRTISRPASTALTLMDVFSFPHRRYACLIRSIGSDPVLRWRSRAVAFVEKSVSVSKEGCIIISRQRITYLILSLTFSFSLNRLHGRNNGWHCRWGPAAARRRLARPLPELALRAGARQSAVEG